MMFNHTHNAAILIHVAQEAQASSNLPSHEGFPSFLVTPVRYCLDVNNFQLCQDTSSCIVIYYIFHQPDQLMDSDDQQLVGRLEFDVDAVEMETSVSVDTDLHTVTTTPWYEN